MWRYLKKDNKVIGKWDLSEERLANYKEMGYVECEEDGCDCISTSRVNCEDEKPKKHPRPPKKKKNNAIV